MKKGLTQPFLSGRRNRIGVVALSLVAAIAMLGASFQFLRLLDTERDMDAIIREDAIWAVFQADRHMRELDRLARWIAETGRIDAHSDFVRHYDILYSRTNLLARGTFHLDLAGESGLTRQATALTEFVSALEPRIDTLDPNDPGYWQDMQTLSAEISVFPDRSNRLLLDANAAMQLQRVSDRNARSAIQEQLATMLIVLVAAFVGIFVLLMVQLRQLAATGRKMALLQERSNRRAVRAQAASRTKSAFLATMSHEMRTPLNGIIGNAELLSYANRDQPQERRLNTILASAFLLRDLIDGVLEFSRMGKEASVTRPEPVDLKAFADGLLLTFEEAAHQRGLSLAVDMPDEVVLLDEALLRQVLAKLIDNAMKFSPDGQIIVRGTRPAPELLRVEVMDQGIGIAAEDIPRLFTDFNQLDTSASRSFGGAGLGLAVCKRIADALGGRLGVESSPGRGSRFWIEMPAKQASPQIAPVPDDRCAADGIRPLHVLIAEDNPINADVLSANLAHLGHRCSIVVNGREALDFLSQQEPDLVFMDMQMPVMDGLEATRAIRAAGMNLPIVGVTANAFAQDRAACLAAGMTGFLPKPLTRRALCAMLSALQTELSGSASVETKLQTEPECPTAESPAAPLISGQFQDLIDMLGLEMAGSFLDRFEAEIAVFQTDMQSAIQDTDQRKQDNLLHTFKGAALTLGLMSSGNHAQGLREKLPVAGHELDTLVRLAIADVVACRQLLRGLSSGE